jgi:hypothetical protein
MLNLLTQDKQESPPKMGKLITFPEAREPFSIRLGYSFPMILTTLPGIWAIIARSVTHADLAKPPDRVSRRGSSVIAPWAVIDGPGMSRSDS